MTLYTRIPDVLDLQLTVYEYMALCTIE